MNKFIIIIIYIASINSLSSQTYCLLISNPVSVTNPVTNVVIYTYNYTITGTEAIDASIRINKADGTRGPLIGGSGLKYQSILPATKFRKKGFQL